MLFHIHIHSNHSYIRFSAAVYSIHTLNIELPFHTLTDPSSTHFHPSSLNSHTSILSSILPYAYASRITAFQPRIALTIPNPSTQ
jgi:hypothetical protein